MKLFLPCRERGSSFPSAMFTVVMAVRRAQGGVAAVGGTYKLRSSWRRGAGSGVAGGLGQGILARRTVRASHCRRAWTGLNRATVCRQDKGCDERRDVLSGPVWSGLACARPSGVWRVPLDF